MPNLRCSCPEFQETALDHPLFVLELASAESITVGIAPHFHSSERRCSMLCSKQTKRMQLMTACMKFGFRDSLGIRHCGRDRIQFSRAAFHCPRHKHGGFPSPYLSLVGLSSAIGGEAEMQQTASSLLLWPWLSECVQSALALTLSEAGY